MPAMETRFFVSAGEAAIYRAAIGMKGEGVPTGILLRLVADEAVLAWLRVLFGVRIPIHIKQSSEIIVPLAAERNYDVILTCENPDAATPLLELQAGHQGQPHVKLGMTFALIEAMP